MLTMRRGGREGVRPKGSGVEPHGGGRGLAGTLGRGGERASGRIGHDLRIDHRSHEAQGIALEPQNQIGAPAGTHRRRGARGGAEADRGEMHASPRRNGERIIADRSVVGGADASAIDLHAARHGADRGSAHRGTTSSTRRWPRWRRTGSDRLGTDTRGEDRFTTRGRSRRNRAYMVPAS